jgi:serine/threonine protein kinase
VSSLTENDVRGVLKRLKRPKSAQDRARMHREASNLRTLSAEGLKVPKVLDGNTPEFEGAEPLYFVMEFIPGKTLEKEVGERGPLGVEKSIGLVLDLAATCSRAHEKTVYHRDIKPNNILVRDFETNELVIVDYGLSFNEEEEDSELTETNEQIRNRFLTLPESTTPGGNRRDPRSDMTAVCAVLYFCLTSKPPVMLRDSSNVPMHRSPGHSIREAAGGDPRLPQLEMLLDRGFNYSIGDRFQSWEELEHRLATLSGRSAPVDARSLLSKAGAMLLQNDRKTRAKQYADAATKSLRFVSRTFAVILQEASSQFQRMTDQFTHATQAPADLVLPSKYVTVFVPTHSLRCNIHFAIVDRDSQFQLIRRFEIIEGAVRQMVRRGQLPQFDGQWEAVYWFDPAKWPEDALLEPVVHESLAGAVRCLMGIMMPGSEGAL